MTLSLSVFMGDVLDRAGDTSMARGAGAVGEGKRYLLATSIEAYKIAEKLEPWQPIHAFNGGYAYETTAETYTPLSNESLAAWVSAAEFYRLAVQKHPANARLQMALAWAELQTGNLTSGRRAVQATLRLSPHYSDVRFRVVKWYLTQWDFLDSRDRDIVVGLLERGAAELPEEYLNLVWQSVRDINTVRSILPQDLRVRRLLLNKLTEQGLFTHRWAELRQYPQLAPESPTNGFQLLARGQLNGRTEPPREAGYAGPWTGTVENRLSGGMVTKVELNLPPGEVVLYFPIKSEQAGGIWPAFNMTVGGHPLPMSETTAMRTYYLLLSTSGGKFPLQLALSNGAVLYEEGRFIERRASLSPVRILTASESS